MWTEITRKQYERNNGRYASDLTDEEWKVIKRFVPRARAPGRPRETDMREVVNALLYIAETGCQWRMLARDHPPCSTVQGYFRRWCDEGPWAAINFHLVTEARAAASKQASPGAGVIDSQSVRTVDRRAILLP